MPRSVFVTKPTNAYLPICIKLRETDSYYVPFCHFCDRQKLNFKRRVREAQEKCEMIFEHIDSRIQGILGSTCPDIDGTLIVWVDSWMGGQT